MLLIDEYPSTKDGAPSIFNNEIDNNPMSNNNDSTDLAEPPIFGGFDF